jgi:hypothetical protein
MLLLPRTDGRVQAYVGQTTTPRQRLLQHRRQPPHGVAQALHADSASVDDLLFVPLEIVPVAARSHFEALWTLRAAPNGCRTLNAYGAVGNPARCRWFWSRRHARQQNVARQHVQPTAQQDIIDLT